MAWIRTISKDEAEGRLARIYDAAIARAGRVFGIIKLMSLEPHVLEASMGFYTAAVKSPRSPLPRWFRELVAVRVSRLNDCFY